MATSTPSDAPTTGLSDARAGLNGLFSMLTLVLEHDTTGPEATMSMEAMVAVLSSRLQSQSLQETVIVSAPPIEEAAESNDSSDNESAPPPSPEAPREDLPPPPEEDIRPLPSAFTEDSATSEAFRANIRRRDQYLRARKMESLAPLLSRCSITGVHQIFAEKFRYKVIDGHYNDKNNYCETWEEVGVRDRIGYQYSNFNHTYFLAFEEYVKPSNPKYTGPGLAHYWKASGELVPK